MSDTRPQDQPDEAMLDLLIKQVTEGLSPDEQRALDVLDSEVTRAWLRDLERASAAVTLAGTAGGAQLPPALAARIARQAAENFGPAAKVVNLDAARSDRSPVATRAPGRYGAYGWLAAAACLVLAIFGWLRSPSPPAEPVAVVAPPIATPPSVKPEPPTAVEERAALLAKSDTLKITLGATKDPAVSNMSGDVVWDSATQRGFLHFTGLAANDPAVHQYQIWIFDSGRDKRYPVDGGVFDVPANARSWCASPRPLQ